MNCFHKQCQLDLAPWVRRILADQSASYSNEACYRLYVAENFVLRRDASVATDFAEANHGSDFVALVNIQPSDRQEDRTQSMDHLLTCDRPNGPVSMYL